MFNLEKSISEWRQQMLAAGIKSPVPLEELETHLREEVEQQMKSGWLEPNAFEISVQRIGRPGLMKAEFEKNERTFLKRNIKIGMGVAGILAGAALTVPGYIQLRDELVVANGRLGVWLLGWSLITWSSGSLLRIIRPEVFNGRLEKAETAPGKQPVKTGAGSVVLLMGVALMLPAAAQVCSEGLVKFEALCWMILGAAFLLGGGLVAFFPYKHRVA
jgi:hypothetical protein